MARGPRGPRGPRGIRVTVNSGPPVGRVCHASGLGCGRILATGRGSRLSGGNEFSDGLLSSVPESTRAEVWSRERSGLERRPGVVSPRAPRGGVELPLQVAGTDACVSPGKTPEWREQGVAWAGSCQEGTQCRVVLLGEPLPLAGLGQELRLRRFSDISSLVRLPLSEHGEAQWLHALREGWFPGWARAGTAGGWPLKPALPGAAGRPRLAP